MINLQLKIIKGINRAEGYDGRVNTSVTDVPDDRVVTRVIVVFFLGWAAFPARCRASSTWA